MLIPYNVPYTFIEFPVKQENFIPSAFLFPSHLKKDLISTDILAVFSPFSRKSYEVKILLPVINLSAIYRYFHIQYFRFKACALKIQPFYRRYKWQGKFFYLSLLKGIFQVHMTEDLPALQPDIVLKFSDSDFKKVILLKINEPFPVSESYRIKSQQFSFLIDADHPQNIPVSVLFAFSGVATRTVISSFSHLKVETSVTIDQIKEDWI